MTRKRKFCFGSIVVVLALMLLWIYMPDGSDEKTSGTGLISASDKQASFADGEGADEAVSGSSVLDNGVGTGLEDASVPLDPKIQRLRDLLDDDSNRDQTLALAYVLANGTEAQQLAAIDAFRWLGGREAKKALIRLRKEAYPAIAAEAGRVLTHLLTEGKYTGSGNSLWVNPTEDAGTLPVSDGSEDTNPSDDPLVPDVPNFAELVDFDAAIWEQAIREAPAASDREELLILMSAFSGTKSVPVLLNLLDSPDPQIREHALDYLEFVTYGEQITTRQEGEDWLARNGAMEELAQ